MKIGVLGGTFNPIHLAHIGLAKHCYSELCLDKLVIMPTFIPPHKSPDDLAPPLHRLEMCRLAIGGISGFAVSDYEIAAQGKSYTYKTLQHLRSQHSHAEFFLILGSDMFLSILSWKNPQQIFKMATICAMQRDLNQLMPLQIEAKKLEQLGAKCKIISTPPLPMSSTDIRARIKNGASVSEFLDTAVAKYISEHKLYE